MAFEGLSEKLNNVFKRLKGRGKLSEADVKEAMREVRMALLEADVSYKVAKDFIAKVSERAVGEEVLASLTPAQQVIKIVNEELIALMGNENSRINVPAKPPCIIMMCGLQGSGKTTHSAKLAKHFKDAGKRPLLVGCDVYRPAAINQLQVVGEKAGVKVFEMGQINPVTIAKEAVKHAKDHGNDIVILDTAGRLHIDEALMNELKEIKSVTEPDEIMLVVDAMTGHVYHHAPHPPQDQARVLHGGDPRDLCPAGRPHGGSCLLRHPASPVLTRKPKRLSLNAAAVFVYPRKKGGEGEKLSEISRQFPQTALTLPSDYSIIK